jgi:dTDP-4-amino-4,6-dideoxygalactose transaminase
MLSFGIGKCLYSGFGGIGLSKDKNLTDEIRSRRCANLSKASLISSILRGAEIGLRTLAHARSLYRFSSKSRRPPSIFETFPADWSSDKNSSKEWHLPSTNLDRGLALYNLKHSADFYERRITLAHRYQRNLAGVAGVTLPRSSRYAMSHYTVRIPAQFREAIQAALRHLGVDTGTLYRFPSYLSRDRYPNAERIGSEVLNLPLDASLTDEDVDYVCECVIRCVSEICSMTEQTGHNAHRLAGIWWLGH